MSLDTFSVSRRRCLGLAAAAALVATTPRARAQDKTTLKVGVSVGDADKIFEVVRKVAARDGLTVQVVSFNDYQLPNAALHAGDLDANAFQHQPFLDSQNRSRGYDIVPAGRTITAPLGFYSRKYRRIEDLPDGAAVGVQNDPSNGNRALLLLQSAGLVTLKPEAVARNTATPLDVVGNPKRLRLVALDAAQLPRSLDDLALASVNSNYASQAGLVFARDALIKEPVNGPYANVIAVRRADRDRPWVRRLVAAYQSPEVRDYIVAEFKGALIPAF